MKEKIDIRNISVEDLRTFCAEHKLPKFRAGQIEEWLWKKRATSFDEMTSLSKDMRNLFGEHFCINPIKIHKGERSIDGTIKYSLQLHDKLLVEGVLIPSKKRITACISSQVGCSLDCTFCATGTLKLERNLTAAEIYDQVFILNEESVSNFGKSLSNIVYMGMGEPLLNYNNMLESIRLITTEKGMGMSPKRITVSTAGIAKMIMKLADDKVRFNLAISLHSSNDETRSKLMSLNDSVPLQELRDAIRYFYDKTNRRITYEYIFFKGINDNVNDAKGLANFCKVSPCKINLIEYNTVEGSPYEKSTNKVTENFISYLEEKNLIVNLRKSKGKDINAACGQLVNKLE
ncbi:MAG TPA: 23S rRNA (adenine(2503)-C(2))-methyltransferase RlmN [Flavobacteriales bacterium]|jgi:23S rRNA (adenine2503-C2)-methyltransferase|nr:23S rRNA (adenine(2503)-C(2))-methyltransferase RlmN [Flavobacteriales bacterium]|tara:strand:+ start:7256 stop:8296 length:1041 start_codon:yes stop_codon:yes gene_type:complete